MVVTRPDSDPADETSLASDVTLSSTAILDSTLSPSPTTLDGLNTVSTTASGATASNTSQLSTSSAFRSSSFTTTSSLTSASSNPSSAGIEWGPAITAAPFPTAESSGGGSTVTSPSTAQASSFSRGQQRVIIATTVLGGTLILAFLIYALYRRRKGATLTEIVHFRRHSGTIVMTPTPRDDHFTALPICREYRYSVRSSRAYSTTSLPKTSRQAPAGIPPPVAHRFHDQNPYIKDLWKTASPPAPRTPSKEGQSFLRDASPPPPPPKLPEMARICERRVSSPSHQSRQQSGDTTKSGLAISIRDTSPLMVEPGTPLAPPNHNGPDRWSWTNSQAPTTPRMYAPSLHSSISSLPRFRTIKSWVKTQTSRIEEERPTSSHRPTKPALKNKASLPTLAPPPPPITRKLSKKNARVSVTPRRKSFGAKDLSP